MKYYIKLNFLEGPKTRRIMGFPVRGTESTLDVMGVGIVAEDGREYYAVCNGFDTWAAWCRYETGKGYRIRETLVKDLFRTELFGYYDEMDSREGLRNMVEHFGKSREQIAGEVAEFCGPIFYEDRGDPVTVRWCGRPHPEFYGYYSDFDWVALCWLFGTREKVPEFFPAYCKDLQQELEEKTNFVVSTNRVFNESQVGKNIYAIDMVRYIKTEHPHFPKHPDTHNALDHARWNHKLHMFLSELKPINNR